MYKEVKEEDSTKELGVHYILKQYVEGIGTKENKADDFKGSALARGQWGVISRVEEGIDKLVAEQFPKDLNGKKINKIVIDVFGFSRGAAAARHFCNEVSKKVEYELQVRSSLLNPMGTGEKIMTAPAGGRLGAKLKAAGFLPVGDTYKIELRFLGLFDTVVSDISSFLSITKPFIPEIKFDISNLNIKAQHEWRKNFPFTPTGSRSTVGMLGSHSDIGGGYAELDLYNPILSFFDVPVGNTTILNDMENYQQFYLNNHISTKLDNKYDHYESIIRETYDTSKPGMTLIIKERRDSKYVPSKKPLSQQNHIIEEKISAHYVLEDNRYISNKLSLVPMYTMLQEAIASEVPFYKNFDETKIKPPYKFEYELPDDPVFKQYSELMQDYVKNRKKTTQSKFFIPAAIYKHIMQKYVHLSAHYGGLSNDFITVKGGDHHLLGNIVFINQPVDPTITNGVVSYERETYP